MTIMNVVMNFIMNVTRVQDLRIIKKRLLIFCS